ncbi:MAG: tyrosine-type recombinase/integrase [Clostridia bacterium]|nr:tyrosine-type recombinase/integrase [Clostridia bacterium]
MKKIELQKRANGKGSAIYLGENRDKPWGARITIGKDENGNAIRHFIDTFYTELDALVCLENYHKEPYSLYIKEEKYNRIVTFPKNPYPLVSVKNPKKDIIEKVKKETYTFKQLYEKFKEEKMLTKEEEQLEKKYHIRPKNKPFGRHYCHSMVTAYHNSKGLYDKVYKDLRASDFNNHIKESKKSSETQRQMVNLYLNLDKFALEEDIIEKGYAQFINTVSNNRKEIKKAKNRKVEKERVFSYKQIDYLWNFETRSKGLKEHSKKECELFVRDFWLMLLYSGCRADELLSVYTDNIFLEDNYFIGGLKTEAGINREIPIHPDVKHLWEKYYNPKNEFLFMQANGNRIDYDYYLYHYKHNFKYLHPEVSEHTAHDARHTLRNELRKINIKDIIINSIIGHSNDDVGEDIYSHISIEEKQEAIKMITYKEEEKKLFILASNQ